MENRKRLIKSNSKSNIAGLYDLEETLGKGHFAVVKAARHVFTNERVAVKVIDKLKLDEASRKSLLKEVLCMKLVQHPNVVRLYEVIDTSTKLFLVLELGKGDLYDVIARGGLSEEKARHYFTQIFQAVSYCHKLHVVHRDLKPENVVYFPPVTNTKDFKEGRVKLTDFGFSNNYSPGVKLDTSCGSLAYSAPEILLGDAYDAPAVDIWSLGVILYTLVVGQPPFQEANDSETLTMIMDVKYKVPMGVSEQCRDLIERMLLRGPDRRISISSIRHHPWLKLTTPTDTSTTTPTTTTPLIDKYKLTNEEHEKIIQQMIDGNAVQDKEEVQTCLMTNAYNYVTSTYYLLAEKLLRERGDQLSDNQRTCSLESLNNLNLNRRCSIKDDPPPHPPLHPPLQIPSSASLASGLSTLTTQDPPKCPPLLEEEEEPEEVETKKKKKKSLFSWLFKRPLNNNNRIYKTKSCSELKIKFN